MPVVEIIAVTYGHNFELKCFINSILAQTSELWELHILHDGPNEQLKNNLIEEGYLKDPRVKFTCSDRRENVFGHNLRDLGLKTSKSQAPYTLVTNCDNYYVPILVDQIDYYTSNKDIDFLYWEAVHNFKDGKFNRDIAYGTWTSKIKYSQIDMGQAVISSNIARKVAFPKRNWDADYNYFEDCVNQIKNANYSSAKRKPSWKSRIKKLDKILFVHN